MPPKALPSILDIAPYKPGEATLPGVAHPVKLASNENPFGPSPKAKAAFIAAADQLALYPEGPATLLREAIARRYGLDAARIVCGAGSDEIFFMLGRAYLGAGDEMIQSAHAFSIYKIVAQQSGAVTRTARNDGLTASVDEMLKLVTEKTKLVFLDNPNNPTGTYLPFSEVRRLHAGLPETVLLVIDAAYAEYARRNDYSPGLELAGEAENVIMTRTFSKIYGLAALRLGWAYGPAHVIDALNRVRGPFNVSTPAQAAGVAAMEDATFMEMSAAHNDVELARISAALAAMGLSVAPSAGNFVLVTFPNQAGRTAAQADAHLRKRGF
ncbi:MAG: histidinol-phosphate transaminase, partial [Hyphomonadaceae bacterium]